MPDPAGQPARVLVLTSQKGGVGKSHLCRVLAVEALAVHRVPVAILDADPQHTLAGWAKRRTIAAPMVETVGGQSIADAVANLKRRGARIILIDTPPHTAEIAKAAVRLADYAILPFEPTTDSLDAAPSTVKLVRDLGTPGCIVLNRVLPGASGAKVARGLAVPFSGLGLPLCPIMPVNRIGSVHATAQGLTPREEGAREAADEMALLWQWVAREAGIPVPEAVA